MGHRSASVYSVLLWQQSCQDLYYKYFSLFIFVHWYLQSAWYCQHSLRAQCCLVCYLHLLQHFPCLFLASTQVLSYPFWSSICFLCCFGTKGLQTGGFIDCKWRVIIDLISSRTRHLALYGAHSLPACTTFSLSLLFLLFSHMPGFIWPFFNLFVLIYIFSPIIHLFYLFLFVFVNSFCFPFFLFDFSFPPLPAP